MISAFFLALLPSRLGEAVLESIVYVIDGEIGWSWADLEASAKTSGGNALSLVPLGLG